MDYETRAIKRLQYAAETSTALFGERLTLAYSSGKDSDVIIALALKANIDFKVVHNLTTADAPESMYHLGKVFKSLEERGVPCLVSKPVYKGERTTMWKLIVDKAIPPTRRIRYCCAILKESGEEKGIVATGVRWDESVSRKKNRGVIEKLASKKTDNLILLNDNENERRIFENCRLKGKSIVNPIVDWPTEIVFDYVRAEKITLNPLYELGFSRVGCIGCPMAGKKKRIREFELFPTYKKAYIRAFGKMLEERKRRGLITEKWKTAQDVFDWWME